MRTAWPAEMAGMTQQRLIRHVQRIAAEGTRHNVMHFAAIRIRGICLTRIHAPFPAPRAETLVSPPDGRNDLPAGARRLAAPLALDDGLALRRLW
jgi:hypothetical protein